MARAYYCLTKGELFMSRYDSMKGKVAIVTGGGSGMARAACLKFAENGVRVAVVDIDAQVAEETVALIEKAGGTAISIKADMGQDEDIKMMVEQTVGAFGRLDYAYNSVGIGGVYGGFEGTSDDLWADIINVDLASIWHCLKAEVPEMLKAGGGVIINTSSVAGLKAHSMEPAYCAAKHGVVGLTKSAAVVYAPQNIRVNAICPGPIFTKMWRNTHFGADEQKKVAEVVPMRRIGQPEEVANVVLFLCSDEASYVTGVALPIDGGMSAL
jgi:NAD(P)-dependent dehydrogenase (short-subunit alcohol dehydrogenase family)